ncbi:MAG: gluconate 2-dehydrogenase subunit 3 family protein [Kordiimonadaceae bacterium]|jgi:gluconate 2-dehydrogenase gamma chain|nr:gluconate 2-dehydrogenase subunit 3 family protein [Kordiimonadaceae bacterium]MBT6034874.1 gluconate 2-dehydrogenase subunit 3 family protein [Kordiimonadaceae bacterium]MBT6328885.1 gluconate 2-dehydrogenase subunit 3 family protein [Kordiimonadaceae bacterium]MBT7582271.1 gluconate 2-dehydrogenase subunit 3 family protein [Kordiimonadaceae bacterium]
MNQKINRRHILQGTAAALGISAASPLFMAIAAYTENAQAQTNTMSIFNASERKMVDILAELIIPETDTPGANAAGVPDFIDMMVSQWYTPEDRKAFIHGLRKLNHHSLISFDKNFLECKEPQQIIALEDTEQNVDGTMSDGISGGTSKRVAVTAEDPAAWGDIPLEGRYFFDQIKSLTVLGFYTSEIGVEHELIYDPQPGSYDGGLDFNQVGKHYTS